MWQLVQIVVVALAAFLMTSVVLSDGHQQGSDNNGRRAVPRVRTDRESVGHPHHPSAAPDIRRGSSPHGLESTAPLSPWQVLRLQQPDGAGMLQHALRESLMLHLREIDAHPLQCLTDDDNLVGDFRIRFVADVVSEPRRARASRWRFSEIVEGMPLSAPYIECMESVLTGPFEVTPPAPHMYFAEYRGPIAIEFAMHGATHSSE